MEKVIRNNLLYLGDSCLPLQAAQAFDLLFWGPASNWHKAKQFARKIDMYIGLHRYFLVFDFQYILRALHYIDFLAFPHFHMPSSAWKDPKHFNLFFGIS